MKYCPHGLDLDLCDVCWGPDGRLPEEIDADKWFDIKPEEEIMPANLGLATTRELLLELKARAEVAVTIGEYPEEMNALAIGAANVLDSLPGSMLDYKTVSEEHGHQT